MTGAVFEPGGEPGVFVPTEHAAGPWDAQQLHGGAPAALVARAVEALELPAPMRCVRLAYDFLGTVPLAPLRVQAAVTRPGRRLALAEASVQTAGGQEVLRARATLLRRGEVHLPAARSMAEGDAVPGPDDAPPGAWTGRGEAVGFHLTAMEVRFARGGWELGPALAWFRLRMPLVADEEPTPLQRVVAAADFGNGVSRELDFATHLFINTDLTVHLHREPEGAWVGLDARTDLDVTGAGQATSVLHDRQGRIGAAAQSLFVDER